MAEAALDEAHVAILLVDGHDGLTAGDEEIATRLRRMGKPLLLVINKLDGMKGGAPDGGFYGLGFDQVFSISAAHGAGVPELLAAIRARLPFHRTPAEAEIHSLSDELRFAMIDELAEAHGRRIPTGELNRFLRETVDAMSPHAIDGKLPKLYFMTQVGVRPPSFVVKANTDRGLHFSYVRYMENRLREKFGLAGVPLRLSIQKKQKGEGEEGEVAAVRRILDPGEGLKPSRSNESLPGPARGQGQGSSPFQEEGRPQARRQAGPPQRSWRTSEAGPAEIHQAPLALQQHLGVLQGLGPVRVAGQQPGQFAVAGFALHPAEGTAGAAAFGLLAQGAVPVRPGRHLGEVGDRQHLMGFPELGHRQAHRQGRLPAQARVDLVQYQSQPIANP